MNLTGLHLLLTYQCNLECDHCFVWGGAGSGGAMTLEKLRRILLQARDLGTVEWIWFEGGEPFLFYPVLLEGARLAGDLGFNAGIVTNAYWATSYDDAIEWLRPFAGLVQDISISSDLFHGSEIPSRGVEDACAAAGRLGIPRDLITIARPEDAAGSPGSAAGREGGTVGQLPAGESPVMFRGRAARKLASRAPQWPCETFDSCPHEDLREPGRVHVDPMGHVHICQGISIGNLFAVTLKEICDGYDPAKHPVTGPLVDGGPLELAHRHGIEHDRTYADACHMCYEVRCALRERLPDILAPDRMYGVMEG